MKISEITQMPCELKSQGLLTQATSNDLMRDEAYKQKIANLMQLTEQEHEHTEQVFLLGYN